MADTPDYAMFLKLMNLTTSSYDGEALNAIRMANAVLARTNQTWEDLLKNKIVMVAPPPDATRPATKSYVRHDNANEINGYFEDLYDRGSRLGTFKQWVDSVHEWWEREGLPHRRPIQHSKAQRPATLKIYFCDAAKRGCLFK